MRRNHQLLLIQGLLQADFGCVFVLGSLQAVVDQLSFIEMRDLVFRRLAIEEGLDVSQRGSRVAFEVAAGVDEEDIVVDELSSDDGWRVCVHVEMDQGRELGWKGVAVFSVA
jgi:hypothetical protein